MAEREKQLAEAEFPARADQLKALRALVRAKLQAEHCEPLFIEQMVLAVNEACMNIIQHAYRFDAAGRFRVEILKRRDELTFRVSDAAATVDRAHWYPRALEDVRPGGLGLHFMHALMDRVEFCDAGTRRGNVLIMSKRMESE